MDLAMTIFGAMIYNKIIDENVGQHIQMCRITLYPMYLQIYLKMNTVYFMK